jgi:hypothetical protein
LLHGGLQERLLSRTGFLIQSALQSTVDVTAAESPNRLRCPPNHRGHLGGGDSLAELPERQSAQNHADLLDTRRQDLIQGLEIMGGNTEQA